MSEGLEQFIYVLQGLKRLVEASFLLNDEQLKEIIQPQSQKLISHLAKIYSPSQKQQVIKLILGCIRLLARLAPQDYLKTRYQKNIEKLVSQRQQAQLETSSADIQKNLDILIEVSGAIQVKDKVWELGMQLVKSYISVTNKFQKKAYKFLFQIMQNVHPSFLPQVADILKENDQTEPFSRFYRLSCVSQIYSRSKLGDEQARNMQDLAEFM